MKDRKRQNSIIFACALIVFLVLLFGTLFLRTPKTFPRDEKQQVVFIGDSNLAFRRDDTDIPEIVAQLTDTTTYNCAIGGTTAVKLNNERYFDYYTDLMCMYNIADIIVTGDLQSFNDNRDSIRDYSAISYEKVKLLSEMDFHKVDYLFIAYGLNDYTLGKQIDDSSDPYSVFTYCGSMRTAIEKIQNTYPNIQIVLCSITYCWDEDEEGNWISGFDKDYGGGTIDAYRDALYRVSEEYSNVYFLDNLEALEINDDNYEVYLEDNMHVNTTGQAKWAQNAALMIERMRSDAKTDSTRQ